MNQQPLVSVVIATRDRPELLTRAVESVLDQTYPRVEIVVVDENDPEGEGRRATSEAVDALCRRRSIIYLSDRSPTMVCTARNEGASAANGELIAFLDDDDYWRPQKLTRQVELFLHSELQPGMVYTGLEVVDGEGRTIKVRRPSQRGNILPELLKENVLGTPSSIMIKAELFAALGGFDPILPTRHDYDLYLRVAQGHTVDFVPEPLTVYLNLQATAMSKNYAKKLAGRRLVLAKHRALYENRPEILSAYYYGSALLSIKHGDRNSAANFLRYSLRYRITLRALARRLLLLVSHPRSRF